MPQKDLHKFHEQTSRLVSDRRFWDMLEELDTNPQARSAATRDARAFVKQRLPELPDEATVECSEGSFSVKICAYKYCVIFTWD